MTMEERQAAAYERRAQIMADATHGAYHRLKTEYMAQMRTPADDTLDRRQEKLDLIRELCDTTQSRSTYERCVAIVGERTP